MSTIITTSAATMGLLLAGAVTANADSTYTVKAGDCVWAIAQQYHSSINTIESANHIQGHLILPGQQLAIPGANDTTSTSTPAATTSTPVAQTQTTTSQAAASTPAAQPATSQATQSAPTTAGSSYTGSNLQSYVLGQMSARTGVSAATWNHIITRESNWQPSVRNSSSGAYGLFQNMHINGGSVEEQVNAAVNLYRVQGMQAWAL